MIMIALNSRVDLCTTIPLSAVAPSVAQKAALRLHAPLNAEIVIPRPHLG
ncbi:hypothetical protein UNSWDHB_1226 [Dehalobacter sp. UNSWDHB]|nr:hypothetical protein DHBDCA_p702 [Dehalobacter sp. DCA]AFV04769.1 hypothetical protein DCF50_p762 [Dehalobacter sp. CF]EQB21464.1 hypothetical protein UNSWDHB_1226 [Dehalobacter sp. UNSWDHB]